MPVRRISENRSNFQDSGISNQPHPITQEISKEKHMEEKTVQKMKENVFSIMFGLMLVFVIFFWAHLMDTAYD